MGGGYGGLQQTDDTDYDTPNIFIASQWNPDEDGGIYSGIDHLGPGTTASSFGGEGTGSKTINDQMGWIIDRWYNMVVRSYKKGDNLHIAVFFQDLTTNIWKHMSTLTRPFADQIYLGNYDDAFLENWWGTGAANDGSNVRKAFFKDCWGITPAGDWVKPVNPYCSANGSQADVNRNGVYHWSFNSGYDTTEDAYFMEHGGNVTRSAAYGGGTNRDLNLGNQLGQGTSPVLIIGEVTSLTATQAGQTINLQWVINQTKSPQWITTVSIVNSVNTEVFTETDTIPQLRTISLPQNYSAGNYSAKIKMKDIFGQNAAEYATPFTISTSLEINPIEDLSTATAYPNPAKTELRIMVAPGKRISAINVIDFSGRKVIQQRGSSAILPIKSLSNGIYSIEIRLQSGELLHHKVLKN